MDTRVKRTVRADYVPAEDYMSREIAEREKKLRPAAGFPRPFGTLGHPNHLGAFLAIVFPLAWYFALPGRRWAMSM